MRNLLLLIGILAGTLGAQDLSLVPRSDKFVPSPAVWRASVTALAVANALDIHSSWGKHELNRALAGPSGNFGRDGALLKLAFQGGLVGLEYLVTRGHHSPKVYRVLSIVNFGAAAAIGGVAAHNYTIPRR
jgi:hypothetical protein